MIRGADRGLLEASLPGPLGEVKFGHVERATNEIGPLEVRAELPGST